jgi:hypothetical protein
MVKEQGHDPLIRQELRVSLQRSGVGELERLYLPNRRLSSYQRVKTRRSR